MSVTDGKKTVNVKSEPDLFQRLIVVAQTRKINLQNILSQELTPVPSSIAHGDGSLNKAVKSRLLHGLLVNA